MAWTAPAHQSIGTLITKTLWDNDQDNFSYLKGLSGALTIEAAVTIEGDLIVDNIACDNVSLDGGYRIPHSIRTFRMNWEDDANVDNSSAGGVGGSTFDDAGGTGQVVMGVTLNQADGRRLESKDATDGIDVKWNVAKNPYAKFEFGLSEADGDCSKIDMFIGLRQTKGNAIPDGTGEHVFGMLYLGSASGFAFMTGNAATETLSGTTTPWAAADRIVLEFKATSATSITCWVNGTLIHTFTTNLPTGLLDWQYLFLTDGTGGATNIYMTAAEIILQESLS